MIRKETGAGDQKSATWQEGKLIQGYVTGLSIAEGKRSFILPESSKESLKMCLRAVS